MRIVCAVSVLGLAGFAAALKFPAAARAQNKTSAPPPSSQSSSTKATSNAAQASTSATQNAKKAGELAKWDARCANSSNRLRRSVSPRATGFSKDTPISYEFTLGLNEQRRVITRPGQLDELRHGHRTVLRSSADDSPGDARLDPAARTAKRAGPRSPSTPELDDLTEDRTADQRLLVSRSNATVDTPPCWS